MKLILNLSKKKTGTTFFHDMFKKNEIRNALALLVKNQVRRIPELFFYNDDSLEHIDSIDQALKKTEDPIKNRSLLSKRKKL